MSRNPIGVLSETDSNSADLSGTISFGLPVTTSAGSSCLGDDRNTKCQTSTQPKSAIETSPSSRVSSFPRKNRVDSCSSTAVLLAFAVASRSCRGTSAAVARAQLGEADLGDLQGREDVDHLHQFRVFQVRVDLDE